LLLVGALAVLGIGAAIVGARSEPNGSSPRDEPAAAAHLRTVVERTAQASSYTQVLRLAGSGLPQLTNPLTVVYNAPDRVEYFSPTQRPFMIGIGDSEYSTEGRSDWTEIQVPGRVSTVLTVTKSVLTELTQLTSVQKSGSGFVATHTSIRGGHPSVVTTYTVHVEHGYVSDVESTQAHTEPGAALALEVRFSRIGTSPPVTAPPVSHLLSSGIGVCASLSGCYSTLSPSS
jgi:hypothetical protein